ncbi:histidinol dehydrogenase [Petrocella atlantisensis]|uniref:Histidinol dehydrogenase n=1 Tax=Petrocella atlantisensis TaxID=2173034 RepID=A0A3P7PN12_9FIRM|nr:histidinol dehydrogenase [Petrocella atlantisensis]VDN45937.1 histidinol dehydrogenase [Petrocella atlantisensis]
MKVYDFTKGEVIDIKKLLEDRAPTSYGDYETIVANIIKNVKDKGNSAILDYTTEFDKVTLTPTSMKVTSEEIREAYDLVDEKLITVIKKAKERVYAFHAKQKQYSWFDTEEDGSIMGQKITPLERVGVYVPGGKAVYTSSVIMDVVPALVAGVKEIVITTPPDSTGNINPQILVAADICGIENIYKMGGAQAIAALAFGTETIKKVDKIVGPGNIFVALAKKAVYGHVSIDSIAGPSEVLVIADETSNPKYIAADLLSQAEHDELASSVLITTSQAVAEKVKAEIERQTAYLKRKDIISASLNNYGVTIIVDSLKDAVTISNEIAPEHLEICTKNPFELMPYIKNAGAIFLGNYTPEPLGDYMAGPNHVLPTNATAKFFSPLSVDDFIKKSSITFFGRDALKALSDDVIYFAESEALDAHANSIKVRFEND